MADNLMDKVKEYFTAVTDERLLADLREAGFTIVPKRADNQAISSEKVQRRFEEAEGWNVVGGGSGCVTADFDHIRFDGDNIGFYGSRSRFLEAASLLSPPTSSAAHVDITGRMVHPLKTWPQYFQKVLDGSKPFEVRKNDRDYREGDLLHLREWNPDQSEYTGRECWREVTYTLHGPGFGLESGFVVMGMRPFSLPTPLVSLLKR